MNKNIINISPFIKMFQRSYTQYSQSSDKNNKEKYNKEKYKREKYDSDENDSEKYDSEKYDSEKYNSDESEDRDSLSPLERSSEIDGESEEDIHLNRIYLENVRIPSNVLIVGPKKSGKSMLIKHVLTHIKDTLTVDSCIVTADKNEYRLIDLGDNWDVISSYDHDLSLGELSNYSVRFIEDWAGKRNNVFDLFQDKRSFNIIAVDRYSHLPSSIRQQVDYVILLGNIKELREIWFDFAGIVPHYSDFRLIYDDCTSGYDFLVIDNFGTSKKIIDHIRWGRIKVSDKNIVKRPVTPFRSKIFDEKDENDEIESNDNKQSQNNQLQNDSSQANPLKEPQGLYKEMPRLSISGQVADSNAQKQVSQSFEQPPNELSHQPRSSQVRNSQVLNSQVLNSQVHESRNSQVTFNNSETRRFSVKMPPSQITEQYRNNSQINNSQFDNSQKETLQMGGAPNIESINDRLDNEILNEEQKANENNEECIIL